MSGIAGFFGITADEKLLTNMNKLQAHRGPDGSAVFAEGAIGFAYTHLNIMDGEGDTQPIKSGSGRYALIFNGRVYNHLDLRTELEALGHSFKTKSDAEVVIEAFDEWGMAAFDRFNGMWGLAIYDRSENRLTLSRDHFGIKSLYYARLGEGLLFASEIKPILNSGLIDRKPNDRVIYRYLRFRIHDSAKETFFVGIEKLLPGEMLVIDSRGMEIQSYTKLRDELSGLAKQNLPYNKAAQTEYYKQLRESVRLCLQSDALVGTSLSGGLDSSAVAVLISRMMNEDAQTAQADEDAAAAAKAGVDAPTTHANENAPATKAVGSKQNVFSAIFPGSINDEENYIDAAIEACGDTLIVHKIQPTADEFKQDILDLLRVQEEPIISSGPYAQRKVMQEAAKHVKVLLDGQGADEIMAGYVPYYLVYLRSLKKQRRFGKLILEFLASLDVLLRLARFRIFDALRFRKDLPLDAFLSEQFRQTYKDERFVIQSDNLKERLLEDIFENSIPSLLRYEDRNTASVGIEGRVPFLNRNLIAHIFSLSDDAIIKGGWNKRIHRDALRQLLPDMITRRRKKIGFTTPEYEWFFRLKDFYRETLSSESFASRPYFNQDAVVRAFDLFLQGRATGDTMKFWRIINVELWLQEFIDKLLPPLE